MRLRSATTTLISAVLLQPASCQDTFDISFNVVNNELYGLSTYSFNISLGTPPQVVPVSIKLDTTDVRIDNTTFSPLNGSSENTYYNPDLSSSAQTNIPNLVLTNPLEVTSTPSGFLKNSTYVYTSDMYSIAATNFSSSLSFISFQSSTSILSSGRVRTFTANRQYHEIGFGLPLSSINEANPRGVINGFLGQSLMKGRAYSLWLNQDKKNGHLLLGGVDQKAFKGPLVSLETTISYQETPLYNYSILAVDASVGAVNTGKNIDLNVPIGKSFLSATDIILLPPNVTTRIWDALGVDYKTYAANAVRDPSSPLDIVFADPVVPCTYLTNTSTISFTLTGFPTPIIIPISDLTYKSPYNTRDLDGNDIDEELCYLNIKPGQEGDVSFLGLPILKKLYLVVDLDGKIVSVAELNGGEGEILEIPKEGVAGLNLTAGWNGTDAGTKGKSGAGRVGGGFLPMVVVGVMVMVGGVLL